MFSFHTLESFFEIVLLHFSLSPFFPPSFPICPLLSFKFSLFFHCVLIHIHIFLNVSCSVHILLVLCMFSSLAIWHRTQYTRPESPRLSSLSRPPLPLPASLGCLGSLCRIESSWVCPQPLWHVQCHPCSIPVGQSCW